MVGDTRLMKVLIALRSMFPYNSAPANLYRNLSIGLIKHSCNVEVHLLCGNSIENYQKFPMWINQVDHIIFKYGIFKVRHKSFLFRIIDDFLSPVKVAFKLLFMKEKPTNIIISDGYFYNYFPIIIIAKILKIKIIKYAVDFYDKRIIVRKWWMLPKYYSFLLQTNIIDKKLDGMICISNYLINRYEDMGFDRNKLLLIPNFTEIPNLSENKRDRTNTTIRIGYAGAAPILNGVDDLIKAFALLLKNINRAELVIIGDVASGKSQLPILKELVVKFNMIDRVTFTERIPSIEVISYINECDILVLARKKTRFADAGFPTKLGEYFSTGKPVLLTRVGDFPYYFDDKKEVVFAEPDNPESFAKALSFLIENEKERVRIGKNGYNWAKANLDHKNNAGKVIRFLERL